MRFAPLAVRLPDAMISEIDAIAAAGLISRTGAHSRVVDRGDRGEKGAEQIPPGLATARS